MSKRSFLASVTATAAALALLTACGSTSPASNPNGSTVGSSTPSGAGTTPPAASTKCAYPAAGPAAKSVKAPDTTPITSMTSATIATNRGTIGITLAPQQTPCTVNSFISLAQQGYFNNTHCHRLTTAGIYVLQCGDPTGTGSGGPGYSFNDELVPSAAPASCATGQCVYPAGTVAMANSGADTNGSQFFLVYQDSPLTYAYTIFGHMSAAGLKVVRQIASHGSGSPDQYGNTPPNESVTIQRATAQQ